MRKLKKIFVLGFSVVLCCMCLMGCESKGESTLLRGAENAVELSYEDETEGLARILEKKEKFAVAFADAAFQEYAEGMFEKGQNFAVSPVSVFMSLSLAAESAADKTREEILSALNLSYTELSSDFEYLYSALNREYVSGIVRLSNSVWVNEGTQVRQDCLNSLAEKFFCTSFSADFAGNNQAANDAVRSFVKEQTNGLIDKDFQLSADTYFALINALYLKDCWNTSGNDLSFTEKDYTFTGEDGKTMTQKFLQGYYNTGRVVEGEDFTTFYTATNAGFKIQFLLPKDGYSVSDVFTEENLAFVGQLEDYNGIDTENKIRYETRCLFPEFRASFDQDIIKILRSFGIDKLFDPQACDLSSLMEKTSMEKGNAYCYSLQHVTELAVDKKGIEGAAVTVMADGSESVDEFTTVQEEFVVDRSFGFILSDRYGTTLFSGAVQAV